MMIEKLLPFSSFSSGSTWQELVGLLTSNTTHFPPLSSRRIKHLLVEVYVSTKVSGAWYSGGTFGFVVVSYDMYTRLGSLLSSVVSSTPIIPSIV